MSGTENNPTDEEMLDYLSGRASADTRTKVETAAAEQPTVAAELALMQGARTIFDQEDAAPPGELGWARLSRAIDQETQQRLASDAPSSNVVSFQSRWVGFAATAAASVVAWQFIITPILPQLGGAPVYEQVSETPELGPSIRVAFDPNITEAELRALLRQLDADVVGVPSAIGLWQLEFQDVDTRDSALAILDASPLVESAQAD